MDTLSNMDPTGVLSAANAAVKLVGTVVRVAPQIKGAVDRARGGSVSSPHAGGGERDVSGRSTLEVEPIDDDQERRAYEKVNMVLKTMGERILNSGLVDVQALARALTKATSHIEVRLFSVETNKLFHSLAQKLSDPVLVNCVFTSIYFIGFLTAELSSSLPNYKDTYYPLGPRIIQQMFKVALGLDGFKENLNANLEAYKTLATTAGLLRPTDIEYSTFRNFPSFNPCRYSSKSFSDKMYYRNIYSQLVKHLEQHGFPQPLQGRDVGVIRDWRFLSGDSNSKVYEVEKADKHIGENFGRVLYWLICSASRMQAGVAVIAYIDQHIALIRWLGPRFGYRVLNASGDLNFVGQHLTMSKKCKAVFDTWVIIMPSATALANRRQPEAMSQSPAAVNSRPPHTAAAPHAAAVPHAATMSSSAPSTHERGAGSSRPNRPSMNTASSGSHTGASLSSSTSSTTIVENEALSNPSENQANFHDTDRIGVQPTPATAKPFAELVGTMHESEEGVPVSAEQAPGLMHRRSEDLAYPSSPLSSVAHERIAASSSQLDGHYNRHSFTHPRPAGGPPSRQSSSTSSVPSITQAGGAGPMRQSSMNSIKRKPTIAEGVDLSSMAGSGEGRSYGQSSWLPDQALVTPVELPAPAISHAQTMPNVYSRPHSSQLDQVPEARQETQYHEMHSTVPAEMHALGGPGPGNLAPGSLPFSPLTTSPVSSPSEPRLTASPAPSFTQPVAVPPSRPHRKAPPRPRGILATAVDDFEADDEDGEEISFVAGDILEIVGKNKALEEDGWCRARVKGQKKIGLAPLEYLEIIGEQAAPAPSVSRVVQPSTGVRDQLPRSVPQTSAMPSYMADRSVPHSMGPTAGIRPHDLAQAHNPATHTGGHQVPFTPHYATPTAASNAHVGAPHNAPTHAGATAQLHQPYNSHLPQQPPFHPGQIQPNLYQKPPQNRPPYYGHQSAPAQPATFTPGSMQGNNQEYDSSNQYQYSQNVRPPFQNNFAAQASMASSIAPTVASLGSALMHMHAHSHARPHNHSMTNNQPQSYDAPAYAQNNPSGGNDSDGAAAYSSAYDTQPNQTSYNYNDNNDNSVNSNDYSNNTAFQNSMSNSDTTNANSLDLSGANISLFGNNSPTTSAADDNNSNNDNQDNNFGSNNDTGYDDSYNNNNNNYYSDTAAPASDLSALSLVDTGDTTTDPSSGALSPFVSVSAADASSATGDASVTSPLAILAPDTGAGSNTADTSSYFQTTTTEFTTTTEDDDGAAAADISPLAVLSPDPAAAYSASSMDYGSSTTASFGAADDGGSSASYVDQSSYEQLDSASYAGADGGSGSAGWSGAGAGAGTDDGTGAGGDGGDGGSFGDAAEYQSYMEDDFSDQDAGNF